MPLLQQGVKRYTEITAADDHSACCRSLPLQPSIASFKNDGSVMMAQ